MAWFQASIELSPRPGGFQLITSQIVDAVPELRKTKLGLLHVFIQHTSASLTINENADPDVPVDLEMSVNKVVPEGFPYIHTLEGSDFPGRGDVPARIAGRIPAVLILTEASARFLIGAAKPQGGWEAASALTGVCTLHADLSGFWYRL